MFELDLDEIARSVGTSKVNTRQILTRARGRLRDARPRFTASRRESEESVMPQDPLVGVGLPVRHDQRCARSAHAPSDRGNGTYSFDITGGRIRAIYVVRDPDKLREFLEHTH